MLVCGASLHRMSAPERANTEMRAHTCHGCLSLVSRLDLQRESMWSADVALVGMSYGVVWCGVVWCGVRCGGVVCDVWCVVCGVWCGVVCGVWCVVGCVVWCVVCGVWWGVVWCVVCGGVWCGVVCGVWWGCDTPQTPHQARQASSHCRMNLMWFGAMLRGGLQNDSRFHSRSPGIGLRYPAQGLVRVHPSCTQQFVSEAPHSNGHRRAGALCRLRWGVSTGMQRVGLYIQHSTVFMLEVCAGFSVRSSVRAVPHFGLQSSVSSSGIAMVGLCIQHSTKYAVQKHVRTRVLVWCTF